MRHFLPLLILIVVLVVVYSLSRLTAEWYYIQPVKAGEAAYVATFDQFTEDWGLYDGRLSAEVVDGALRLTADDVNRYPFSVAKQHWGDFDLTVQATPVDGPEDNGYGVIFRLQNRGNISPDDDYFYMFLISSDGYYQVTRSLNGQQKIISNWIPSDLIRQGIGATNQVRVTAVGDQFRFYINGEPVQLCLPNNPDGISTYLGECIDGQMTDVLTDSTIPSGQLGVVIQSLDEPGVVVDFDNVVVVGPEGV